MSWLSDVKNNKQRALEEDRDWGFMCGYCSNSFFNDYQQLEDHQNAGKHKMCKGKDDKFQGEKP